MPEVEARLIPPKTKEHLSVARLTNYWYIACRSEELKREPLAKNILGIPVVLFRDRGRRAHAVLDRCPHRNVPLSLGRVTASGYLQCAYHGWEFDGTGLCRLVPGLADSRVERRVEAFATEEQDGFVWVYPTVDAEPEGVPYPFLHLDLPGYQSVVREVEVKATLLATLENALDVPHTAYLHRGLFRGGKKHPIVAKVTRTRDRVVAEYHGEPRPPGVVARILSPSGGTVEHWDRFLLPSIAQVEYRLGRENHFVVTSVCTPVSDFHTRMFAVVAFKTRMPGRIVRQVLEPFALRVFRQDAAILEQQTRNIKRFGGEQFMSTEIDILGHHIWRLLKQAEQGHQVEQDALSDEPLEVSTEVRFWA